VSPLGSDRDAFTTRLLAGETGIRPIADFDVSTCQSTHAARIRDFDPTKYLPPLKLRRVDIVGRVALGATRDALDHAGLPATPGGADHVGVVLGSFSAGVHSTGEYLESFMKGGPTGAPAILFSSTVGNAPAAVCGLEYGLRGPNVTLMHKEASGLSALVFGAHLVRRGKATTMVAGGVDDIYDRFYRVHDWFGVMSPVNGGDPGCRPFDADRNGFVMGEGGFMCVLEDADTAAARGVPVLAEVLGTGASGSSSPINAWPTDGVALARAMRLALDQAGVPADAVDLVYASANGTAALDRCEAAALRDVFGDRPLPVTSIKGAIGEFGSAGAASAAAAILCGHRDAIAPTAGFSRAADDCPLHVVARPTPPPGPTVLVNSFASGGTNFSVLLRIATS